MENNQSREKVVQLIKSKTSTKRDVFENTKKVFDLLKQALKIVGASLIEQSKSDRPIHIEFTDKGQYETRIKVGGDTLIFLMHTNVFDFEKSHRVHKTALVRNNPYASLCGQIYVYNFLSDSFKYSRSNDLGYLVARISLNKDSHFFVEGKKQLTFLFNDFENDILTQENLTKLIDSVILYALEFDLLSPPFDNFTEVTVDEIEQMSSNLKFQTGKRMGFKFGIDDE